MNAKAERNLYPDAPDAPDIWPSSGTDESSEWERLVDEAGDHAVRKIREIFAKHPHKATHKD